MPLVEAIDVAKAARARALENLRFSALYNLIAAPAAAAGLLTPLIAALAMSGSSLIVTLNALRLQIGGPHMDIMIFLIPAALLLGAIGLAAFFWSLRSGQYEDLDGAAHRILIDDED